MSRVLARKQPAIGKAKSLMPPTAPVTFVDAVYRKGAVVDARLLLSHDQAMRTARELASERLTAKLEADIKKAVHSPIDRVSAWSGRKGNIKSTYHPIVDYPFFVITVGEREVQTRLSLTVCRDESKSKLWTRVSPVRDKKNKGGAGLQGTELLSFFDAARAIGGQIEPVAQAFYQEHLNKIAPEKVLLDILHHIEVAAVDCFDGEAWRLLDAVRAAERRGEPIKSLTTKTTFKYLWDALDTLFAHLTGVKVESLGYPEEMEPMRVEVDDDRKGFFFWKKAPKNREPRKSFLIGLCPTDQEYSDVKSRRVAHSVTALLINRLASSL